MIKRDFTVLCCVSLCFAVSLFFPSLGRSTLEVDDSLCMKCHTAGDLHGVGAHNNCTSQCHDDIPHGGVITFPVRSSKCVACHPFDDPGECTLIDFHQGMTDCLSCHAADCEGGETTTTTATDSPSHIDTCLVCHDAGSPGAGGETIHGDHTDASCSDCHNGAPRTGNVEPDNCIACHPLDNPGYCNLVDFHDPDRGGDCHKCHIDCDESTNSHIEECLLCHVLDDLHERSGHGGDCAQCHDGTPLAGNVQTDKCIVCHPLGNTGKCNLENYHDPGKGASCLECHFNCAGSETTTTTTASTGGHAESGIVDDTLCLACHDIGSFGAQDGTLHGEHSDCDQCHEEGVGRGGNVQADKCIVCHSLGNPGECNVVNDHGGACLNCHDECTGGEVTTTVITTTTAISFMHIYTCLSCHELIDLHANQGHSVCVKCHESGNVEVGKCVVCHPTDGPGKCNLANDHHPGACLKCHDECVGGPTTTTTASSFEQHIDTCLECHVKDDLHAEQEHADCTQCHEGSNVEVGKCVVCHPTGDPGKCNLANDHHSSACLKCHSDCSEDTTTTTAEVTSTTTTIEDFPNPVTIDIDLKPDSVFRSHLIPLPLIMFIEGTESHFNRSTTVSFECSAIWPPIRLILSQTKILVVSIINPAGLRADNSSEVTVNVSSPVDTGEEKPYEEVGSSLLTLTMLPFILDEKQEKLTGGI